MSRKTRRKNRKKTSSLMVPAERQEYQLGSIAKLAVKGATSLLRGAKDDASQSLKSLENKLTSKPSDPNITSFTTKELTEQRKKIGDDAYKDYLSEFSIIRDQDEAIAKIAKNRNISFKDAEDIYQNRIYEDPDPYEGGFMRDDRLTSRDLRLIELEGDRYERMLKEEYNYNEEMLFKVKQRNNNYVDYVEDLKSVLQEEGVSQAELNAFKEIDPPGFAKGGEVPVDTYPNIPPEEMAAAQASQLPDEQMEDDYIDYVMNEALSQEEQTYLMNALEADPQLSMIFDKVVGTASEFTGSGEVAGPGTGVSDSIPARLSDGEFVFTRKATDQLGANNLQRMMDDAERAYDGGLMKNGEEMERNINEVMMSANQMPSLNVRQR